MKRGKKSKLLSLLMAAALALGMTGTTAFGEAGDYDPSVISDVQDDVSSDDIAAEPVEDEIQAADGDVTESEPEQTFAEEAGEEPAEEDSETAEDVVPEEVEDISEDIDEEEILTPAVDDGIAVIESTGVKYATVQEAVDAAGFGDTIIMLADSAENITVGKDVTVTLNLDGFTLAAKDKGSVITVCGSLTLTDSGTRGGTAANETGKITGGKADYGGGVYISDGGVFIMKGGAVAVNTAKYDGGGVYAADSSSPDTENTFEMSGGAVTGNSADDRGGGVYIGTGDVMTMSDGAAIYNNSADAAAADILAKGNDTVKLIEADEMDLLPEDAAYYVYDGWYPDTEDERYADAEDPEKADVSEPMESVEGLIAGCEIVEDYGISTLASTSKSTSTSNTYMARPSTSGRLKVVGTQLCDQNGNAVQLKGVSSHGLSWYPEYVNSACMSDLSSWGANVFRLAMYTAEYNGYCTGSSSNQTTLKNLIKTGVNAAKANDMYVIIDWHILSDSNPLTYQSQAKSFFTEMAKEFSGYNNVIYEICNEPNSGTSWSDIKSYANTIIPAIRKYDSNAVIIVGTPTWSQDVDTAAASPLTKYDNIMYALHFYAATHKDDLRNKMVSAINAGLPVFVSEYGICDSSGSGSIDESSANTWVSLMNQYGVSYVMWNMSNKDESSSILKSSCTKTSGFSYDDLSQSGRWILSMLGGSTTASSSGEVKKSSNAKWYYYVNGSIDYSYTGFATNSNGKWYVEKGLVTKSTNGVFKDKTGALGSTSSWYYVLNSKVQTGFTGLANYKNSSGWWYITKGKVDRSYNGLAKNKNGWFYLTNGKVNRSYTGLATNSNGTWYVKNGKVQKSYTGTVTINGKKYSVKNGKV